MAYKGYVLQNLYEAIKVVTSFACDKFELDCTNGITLRDAKGVDLAGGSRNVARRLYAERMGEEAAAQEYASLRLIITGVEGA